MIYKCERCGARLDPGEKCDCTTKKEEPRGDEDSSKNENENEIGKPQEKNESILSKI